MVEINVDKLEANDENKYNELFYDMIFHCISYTYNQTAPARDTGMA